MSVTFDIPMATHFASAPTSNAKKKNQRHRRCFLKNSSVRDHASFAASSS